MINTIAQPAISQAFPLAFSSFPLATIGSELRALLLWCFDCLHKSSLNELPAPTLSAAAVGSR